MRDYDNDGAIFKGDVGAVIRSVKNLKPSESELGDIMKAIDDSGKYDGGIYTLVI